MRIGKFKAIRKEIFIGNLEIELYDLEADIQETKNIAWQFPEIVKQAERALSKEHMPSALSGFRFPALGEAD